MAVACQYYPIGRCCNKYLQVESILGKIGTSYMKSMMEVENKCSESKSGEWERENCDHRKSSKKEEREETEKGERKRAAETEVYGKAIPMELEIEKIVRNINNSVHKD